jgi:LPXTG-motif cell wall-anchored protein
MLSKKIIISACAAAMFAAANARPALAQEPIDSRTTFTFNAPVELPGVTLPPGTYVFRFVDATTGRKVMQVLAKDDSNKTYGLFLTINAQRPKPSDDAELRFLETPAGKPAAVKTWWYPGNSTGREFIYPKEQARRLAMATNTTVLTTKAENVPAAQMQSADLAYVSPTGDEQAVNEQMVDAAANTAPVGTSGTMSNAPVQESTSAANMSSSNAPKAAAAPRSRLPKTDTTLPLFALMGLSSLASGVALRVRR